ncbi:hypothetical protein DICSQDRAFT_167001 [Dichomitus squalens LYAD-421 SS1]|uniref:uncharacterized protein n=1 Tax=Dichomitus squalens (strain LYAD-421) TaxID=732165 RepID=UPI000441583A|nr:uncharacterized protein DICSQDRAFT_167001 [Dichomitus squalens LYAD-421 SS1]EJF64849.1 hypothetical protein DICSQDRAFT_167001 [Dichomitus squalens LYAD-421 SS1]
MPAELWYPIIEMLPSVDQKTCLSVSEMFHDIALTYVFSHVSISLGLWRPFEHIDDEEVFTDDEKADLIRRADASYEVLRHIMRTPDFARKVKRVSVRAFSCAGVEMQLAIRFLADALEAIPELRGFFWHGSSPRMPLEVFKVLANSSHTTLRELGMPQELPEGAISLLSPIHDLTSLTVLDQDADEPSLIRDVLEANANTLRALRLAGETCDQCLPMPSFASLAELDIVGIQGHEELGELFAHCTHLRALSLVFTYAEDVLIPVLRAQPKALPDLDSFKIWSVDYSGDDLAVLARFLQKKKRLRRMDVMVRVDARWLAADTALLITPILEIMPKLRELQVVGLSVRVASLQKEHIQDLEVYLPDNLTALLIWVNISSSSVPADEWIELFNSRRSLRYLHLVPDFYDALKLKAAVLNNPPPNLELFGYGAQIRPIGRDPTTGAVVVRPRWPYPKVYFRTADDYGNDDWEWLLRYHGNDEDEHFMDNADAIR